MIPRRPTINDVAALAGVSIKTVSRVFNRSPKVRQATHDKVLVVVAVQVDELDVHHLVRSGGGEGARG